MVSSKIFHVDYIRKFSLYLIYATNSINHVKIIIFRIIGSKCHDSEFIRNAEGLDYKTFMYLLLVGTEIMNS